MSPDKHHVDPLQEEAQQSLNHAREKMDYNGSSMQDDFMSFQELRAWLSGFEAMQKESGHICSPKEAKDALTMKEMHSAPSSTPTSSQGSSSPRDYSDAFPSFSCNRKSSVSKYDRADIAPNHTEGCSQTVYEGSNKPDGSARNGEKVPSCHEGIRNVGELNSVHAPSGEPDKSHQDCKLFAREAEAKSEVCLHNDGKCRADRQKTVDRIELKFDQTPPTTTRSSDGSSVNKSVHAAIRKFGGGQSVRQKSFVEQRKDQLHKLWKEDKKTKPVTKVKWSACDGRGIYKKNLVFDIEYNG